MNIALDRHREELSQLCRKFRIRRLEAFGSILRSDFSPASDVDLLVEFDREAPMDAFEQYFGFKESVEQLVGRPVDLVVADAVRNEVFKSELKRTKAPLYVAV